MIYKFLAILLFINASYATSTSEILEIPDQTCCHLKDSYSIQDSNLDKAIDCYINNGVPTAKERVIDLTPDEARLNFSDYVQQKLMPHNLNAKDFFTEKFFGYKDEDDTSFVDPQSIISRENDLYPLLDRLLHQSPSSIDNLDILEDIQYLFLETLFLPPQILIEACIKDKRYSCYLNPKDYQSYAQAHPLAIERLSSYFGIPEDKNLREKRFLENGIGFFTPDLIQDMFNIACVIMQNSAKGDDFLIPGNSPYFIGRALKSLSSTDESLDSYRNIIDFPFSGTPNDARTLKCMTGYKNDISNKDILTSDRLEHLTNRLLKAELLGKIYTTSHTTHIIDVIHSCKGIYFLIKTMLSWEKNQYKKTQEQDLFDHEVQKNMRKFNIFCFNSCYELNANILAEPFDPKDPPEKSTLYLPTNDKPHFKIPVHFVYSPYSKWLSIIPDDWRLVSEAHACFWNNNFNSQKKSSLRGRYVTECFNLNIKKIMMKICDDKQFDEKSRQELIEHCDRISKVD